jgi:hypothetical protein
VPPGFKVFHIPDRSFMKAGTPNLYFVFSPPMNFMGTSTLDELHGLLKGCFSAGGKKQMEMVRHHNELMERVCGSIAIPQHTADQNLRIFGYLKDGAVLPGLRCDEVSAARRRSVF